MCPSLVTTWKHFESAAHKPSLKWPVPLCFIHIGPEQEKGPSPMLTGRLAIFLIANSTPQDLLAVHIIGDTSGGKFSHFKQCCAEVCPLTPGLFSISLFLWVETVTVLLYITILLKWEGHQWPQLYPGKHPALRSCLYYMHWKLNQLNIFGCIV